MRISISYSSNIENIIELYKYFRHFTQVFSPLDKLKESSMKNISLVS